jgi:hypothetical protein
MKHLEVHLSHQSKIIEKPWRRQKMAPKIEDYYEPVTKIAFSKYGSAPGE